MTAADLSASPSCLDALPPAVRNRYPWLEHLAIREVFTPDGDDLFDAQVLCPSHRDRNPSAHLTIRANGMFLIHCAAGCPQEAVLEALGAQPTGSVVGGVVPALDGTREAAEARRQALLEQPERMAELAALGISRSTVENSPIGYVHMDVKHWLLARRLAPQLRHRLAFGLRLPYATEDVGVALVVPPALRLENHNNRIVVWGRQGISGGLDQLDPAGGPIWIFEGPRTAAAGRELGFQAIGMPYGKFKVTSDLKKYFRRFEKTGVVVVGDAGTKGASDAEQWATSLRSVVQDVRHLVPFDLPDKYDVADLLADEGPEETAALLDDLLKRSQPIKPRKPGPTPTKTTKAEEWLKERLTGTPRLAAEVKSDFLDLKVGTEATLRRAKANVNVKSFRKSIPGPWSWVIEGEATT